jgi:carotenoid cleavage dioxygenase-like enzyme
MHVDVVGKYLSTLPEDDDHPYRTGPWRPQTTEWDADDLTVVEGQLPTDLDGVYLRNTENPLHPALKAYHPFDGDGMVHVVGFRDGKRSTATGSSAPTVSPRKTTRPARCGQASRSRSSWPAATTAGAQGR